MKAEGMADEFLTTSQAAQRFPQPVHERTVVRRITEGVKGIKLQALFDGDRYWVKPEWIDQFLQRTTQLRVAHRPVIEDESEFWERFRSMKRKPKGELASMGAKESGEC